MLYELDYRIYQLAKKLGQSEEQIKEQFTPGEIAERTMFDLRDDYVQRELNK